jgi:BRCT domain type II-containing protein
MHKKLNKRKLAKDANQITGENTASHIETPSRMENDESFKKALQEVMDDYPQAFKKLAE